MTDQCDAAPSAPRPVWARTNWSSNFSRSFAAPTLRSSLETMNATRKAVGMENKAGWS